MWDIARAFGTSVDALRRLNTIGRGSRIYVGQRLKLPSTAKKLVDSGAKSKPTYAARSPKKSSTSTSTKTKQHKVKKGDTLWEIARAYNTTTGNIRRMNDLGRSSRIYPGQVLTVSKGAGSDYLVHKVRRGETLSRIAKKYRTTVSKILAANGLTNPDQLRIGKKLKIYTR